jgi:hypothetical protein
MWLTVASWIDRRPWAINWLRCVPFSHFSYSSEPIYLLANFFYESSQQLSSKFISRVAHVPYSIRNNWHIILDKFMRYTLTFSKGGGGGWLPCVDILVPFIPVTTVITTAAFDPINSDNLKRFHCVPWELLAISRQPQWLQYPSSCTRTNTMAASMEIAWWLYHARLPFLIGQAVSHFLCGHSSAVSSDSDL